MIAVYCGKAAESWISAEGAGLIGVVAGASIAFIGNYIVQNRVLKRTAEIENQKIRASTLGQQVLGEVYNFLDQEAKFLQDLRLWQGSGAPNGISGHRLELAKIHSLIKMFGSKKLESQFNSLLPIKNDLEADIVHSGSANRQAILDKGVELIADIKATLMSEIISPIQPRKSMLSRMRRAKS
ncbi:hypothetical protein ACMD47_001824 [Serratia marcescens]|uniref:hypothetical protein n=1 Tax=Serratia sarumanii TaxID=3020826 RepID=UPI002ACFD4F9|nr:hypothetical protein [Serratia marcescens]EMC1043129.1 hypothetical protein [Serratia marcescens]HBV0684983.1 hypothetical protein [Serratia marcescens]